MAKFTAKNLNSGFADTDALNENFTALETFSDTVLSRDGTLPNQLIADIDMNSNRIINALTIDTTNLTVNGQTLVVPANPVTLPTDPRLYLDIFAGALTLTFDTLTAFVADTTGKLGEIIFTQGYGTIRDDGAAIYEIVAAATGTDDGFTFIDLPNTIPARQARAIFPGGKVNVKQGGALGDGATEDTAAIENVMAAGFNYVIFPKGTYLVEATDRYVDPVTSQSVPAGIRFRSNMTVEFATGVKIKQIVWAGVSSGNDDAGNILAVLSINDVKIIGNGATFEGNFFPGDDYTGRDNSSNHGMHIGNSENVYVSDCQFINCWGDGYTVSFLSNQIEADNSRNIHITDCSTRDTRRNGCSFVGVEGFSIKGGSYEDVATVANDGVSPWAGMDLEPNPADTSLKGGNRSKVINGTVTGITTKNNPFAGITIGPGTATPPTNITSDIAVAGCSFLDGVVLTKCEQVTVSVNTVQNLKDDPSSPSIALNGVLMLECTRCVVSKNTVLNTNGHGIFLDIRPAELNTCDDNTVIGNDISSVGRKTNATYHGIFIEGDSNLIALNKIRNAPSGNQPDTALKLETTANDNNVFFNDSQDAGSTAAYTDVGTNNTVIGVSGTGDKRLFFNVSTATLPTNNNQGLAINDFALQQAFTGGGNAVVQSYYDGVGIAGQIEVDGSQQTKYYSDVANNVFHTSGNGTPESALTAGVGSTYGNRNPVATEFASYHKRTGAGNTGWEGLGTVL